MPGPEISKMRNSLKILMYRCFWIGVQLCLVLQYSEATTQRVTRKPGESLKVKCPPLPEAELRAMSFFKHGDKVHTTFYSKLANNAIKKLPGTGSDVQLDDLQRVMTVSKLSMKDNGMTFSCKLVSLHQELQSNVHVTIVVAPELTLRFSPKAPYRNNTSVTVICEIPKVNPPLKGDKITLSIGDVKYDITKVRRNPDLTWSYVTTKSYYVTKKNDDRKLVSCGAKTRGIVRKLEKTARLQFIRPPKGTPRLTVSSTVIRSGDELILRCLLHDLGVPSKNTYLFYQNGVLVKRNGPYSKLTVKVTSSVNAGSYSCKVANSEGASNFSKTTCVAFTTTKHPGRGIPLWLSVVSILLNVAALAYIVMFYIKPRVLTLVEKWRKKSKEPAYTKDGFRLNKEENQNTEKHVPIGVKVIYDDNSPYDNAESRGFSVAKLSKPKPEKTEEPEEPENSAKPKEPEKPEQEKDEATLEAKEEEVLPDPLPEPPYVMDPRAPQGSATPTEAYEDLRL